MTLRFILAVLAFCFCGATFAQPKADKTPALKGHDPVSYFVDGRPVKGVAAIAYDFDDSRYHFSTPKNRELFAASPDRYAPQFAGLCTAGLAMGVKAQADPSVWKIVDGKLYVFSSVGARDKIEQDPAMLAKAHQTHSKR